MAEAGAADIAEAVEAVEGVVEAAEAAADAEVAERRRFMVRTVHALRLCLVLGLASAAHESRAQPGKTFETPEAAGAALIAAFEANDDQAIRDIFGAGSEDVLDQASDPVVAESRKDLAEAGKKKLEFDRSQEGRAILLFGEDGWPSPIPLVPDGNAWRFDVAAGREEVLARRLGRNELRALAIVAEYPDVQLAYAAVDRDGDRVLEYAQRLGSTPGQRDGLYWDDAKGDDPSPIGVQLGDAARPAAGEPYGGYVWKILTAQGPNAAGGAHSYVINGNMIAGFALVGAPAVYKKTGVMTFIVSNNGTAYQKDLGAGSADAARAMEAFDPDASWTVVDPDAELAEAE
jgi:hypothetical protein